MILTIAEKEFFQIVKTLRFLVVILLCLIIMPISVWTLSSDFNRERKDYFDRLDVESRNERRDRSFNLFRPIPTLLPFVRGIDDDAVNTVNFSNRSWNRQSTESTQSNTQMIIPTVDTAFLVGIVLGGLAFLLTFDSICGEKGGRTLSLMSSYAVSRSSIVIGKWVGITAAVLTPLLLGFCMCLCVYAVITGVNLGTAEFLALALLFLLCLLYISAVTIVGVAVSALSFNQSTSLFICLGIWGLFCYVLPQTANATSSAIYPLEPTYELQRRLRTVENDGLRKLTNENLMLRDAGIREGWDYSKFDPLRLRNYIAMAESNHREYLSLESEFSRKSRIQEEISGYAALASPYGCFKMAAMSLAGTGPESHRGFVDEAYRFAEEYFDHLRSTMRNNPEISTEEMLAGLPKFEYGADDLAEKVGAAVLPSGVLALVCIVFVAVAVIAFNRYDVR